MAERSCRRLAPVVAVAVLAAGSCSDEQTGDTAAFCADITANEAAIAAPQLTTQDQIEDHLAIYRDLAAQAPLVIDEDWDAIVGALETMSTVDPGDPESEQRALAQMYATQSSYIAVRNWTQEECSVNLPLATVPGAPVATATATTAPTTDN